MQFLALILSVTIIYAVALALITVMEYLGGER